MSGAFWSKPLWDSDSDNDGESDGWFSAPSVMSIAKIAVSVAGGGPWMSFALDALDTAANVAMGNMSLKDGALGLAKGAAVSAVGQLTSDLGNSWTSSWTGSVGSFGGAALAKAASMSINQVATIGINSFDGSGFNFGGWSGFGKQLAQAGISVGVSSIAAGISHSIIASSGATYGKNAEGGYGWTRATGSTGINWFGMSKIQKLGGLAGGLFEQGANYALGRDVTLNMANFGMFGGPDAGFLELSFNRKSGMKGFQFGTGGLDMSAWGLAEAAQGSRHMSFLDRMENGDVYGAEDKLDVINLQGYSGDASALATANGIIDGEINMLFGSEGGHDLALNQGRNDRDNNSFYISDRIESGNLHDLAVGAVVASHEGGHLGYGPITERDGMDRLYGIDVNVWNGLKKNFNGLQDRGLDAL